MENIWLSSEYFGHFKRSSTLTEGGGGIGISLSNASYGFSSFGKEVTPCSHAKTVIPRDLLYSLRLLPKLSFRGTRHYKHSIALKQSLVS